MTKKAADKTTQSPGTAPFTVRTLGLDLLDATWRIVVPVLIFAIAGIIADRTWGTKPWMTLLAVIIGFVFAALLIKRLLRSIEREDSTSDE